MMQSGARLDNEEDPGELPGRTEGTSEWIQCLRNVEQVLLQNEETIREIMPKLQLNKTVEQLRTSNDWLEVKIKAMERKLQQLRGQVREYNRNHRLRMQMVLAKQTYEAERKTYAIYDEAVDDTLDLGERTFMLQVGNSGSDTSSTTENEAYVSPTLQTDLRLAQEQDDKLRRMKNLLSESNRLAKQRKRERIQTSGFVVHKELLCKIIDGTPRIVVPKILVKEIIRHYHDTEYSGHRGIQQTHVRCNNTLHLAES